MMNKLTPKKFALTFILFLLTASVFAQKSVTGKVTDSGKRPVAGATIAVKGTNVATTTSTTGDFSIVVPKGRTSLIVSYVGFEDQTVDVGNSSSVSVSLKETTSALNEIVVTGYTAQKKKDIAGSVAVVNVKDMKQTPAGTTEEALQGRASGLTVISSGQPGAGSDIRIRGITGFGNNTPLIIVDGVRSSLTDLNMNDIESIQVLKDASAAIYGVAGSNGAIIVTTKKGKSGKAKLSYDGYYGVRTQGKGYDMANTAQEGAAIWQQQKNSGIANPSDKQFGSGPTPVIPDFITPYGVSGAGPNPATYDINSNQITRANKVGTNWYKEITRAAPTQSHTVSLSSGSDKSSYFFSLGYLNEQGNMKYQYNERYSLRANTSFTIKDHIRVGENAFMYYKKNPTFGNNQEGSPFSVAFRESAIIPVYDIAGNFAGTKSQGLGNAQNPFANIYRTKDNVGNTWNMTGNVWGEIDLAKHLTFRTSFGGTLNNNYSYNFNYVAYENAEGNTGSNSFNEGGSFNTAWTYTNTLNYSNSIGKHTFVVLAGKEDVYNSGRNVTAGRSNYFSENPNFWTIGTGSPIGPSNDGGAYKSTISSWFGRAEYSYDGKYIVNATFRRDGSSFFTPEQRYGNFPGVSVAWRLSQEKFMQKVSVINDLKIRGSYGEMGSTSNVNSTNPFNLYGSNAGRSFYDINGVSTGAAAGFFRSNIGNPNTTWEKDVVSNIGFDVTMLNNKLDFTFDVYKKKISGMLYGASGTPFDIVFTGDASLPRVNIGDMQNTGIDMNITYHAKLSKDSRLDITGTFTTYKNKLVSIPGLPYFDGPQIRNIIPTRNEVGHPVGSFFGYKVLGLFKDAQEVSASPKQTDAQPGVFKYADINGDGVIDAADRTYIGDPNAKFSYGLNLAYSYKNFDASAFVFGSAGNDIFDNTKIFTDFPDFFKGGIRREVAVNSWTTSNTGASIPRLSTSGSFSTDLVSNSYFISKGSYLRLKQVQLGYTMPAALLTKYGIDRLRVYVQAANLFTITSYKGLDPELQPAQGNGNIGSPINGFGIDNGNYPHTASFLIGVNLSF
jgi:TonB-linked SusC/RagA family outer membrane protein